MAKDYSYKAADIIKNPAIVDDHPGPIMMIWDWSVDNTGKDTANALVVLARKKWVPILMTSSPGGGMSGRQIAIYTTLRKSK